MSSWGHCLPLKVGRGVAGLGWGLRCLLFPIGVSVLGLILGARRVRNDKNGRGPSLESPDPGKRQGREADLTAPIDKAATGEDGARPSASVEGQGRGLRASLTSCSESVPDSFLSLPLLPIPPFFRLLLPGFRPLWGGTVHLPAPSPAPTHLQALWPWPSAPGRLALAPHLRAPLSPSMWLSSPSPCMSGTDATRSFKKSNCCSSSMHCFLEGAGGDGIWQRPAAWAPGEGQSAALDVGGREPEHLHLHLHQPTCPFAVTPHLSQVRTHGLYGLAGLPGASRLQPPGLGPSEDPASLKRVSSGDRSPQAPGLHGHSQVRCGHGLGVPGLGHLAGLLQQRLQEQLQGPGSGASRRTPREHPRPPPAPTALAPGSPDRIQMMTGTAAATFPISSSVCMIFLIRAWEGGRELGPHRFWTRKRRWGKRGGLPGGRGRGAPKRGG